MKLEFQENICFAQCEICNAQKNIDDLKLHQGKYKCKACRPGETHGY